MNCENYTNLHESLVIIGGIRVIRGFVPSLIISNSVEQRKQSVCEPRTGESIIRIPTQDKARTVVE